MNSFKHISVIVPAKNAGRSIGRALDSILNQPPTVPVDIFVAVDKSSDNTESVISEYDGVHPNIHFVTGDFKSAGAARNAALDCCSSFLNGAGEDRGFWLGFLDADDAWGEDYLSGITDFLAAVDNPKEIQLLSVQQKRVDTTGAINDNHPLRYRFYDGSRVVDLNHDPAAFTSCVTSTLVRTGQALKQRFHPTLRWSEDADFVHEYLRKNGTTIGLVAGASYLYSFGDRTSATQSAWSQAAKYTLPFDQAYFRWCGAHYPGYSDGQLPQWVQWMIMYELHWYMEADRRVVHPARQLPESVRQACGQRLTALARCLTPAVVKEFSAVPWSMDRRCAVLAQTVDGLVSRQIVVYRERLGDGERKCTWFTSPNAKRQMVLGGTACNPNWDKVVRHSFFGGLAVDEHITWRKSPLPDWADYGGAVVQVSRYRGFLKPPTELGQPVMDGFTRTLYSQRPVIRILGKTAKAARFQLGRAKRNIRKTPAVRVLEKKAKNSISFLRRTERTRPQRLSWSGVDGKQLWLLLDRHYTAGDNGEAFAHWLLREHGNDIDLRFAVGRDSEAWGRLNREGFRLLDIADTSAFQQIVTEADVLAASDLSVPELVECFVKGKVKRDDQLIVFLQHGVLRADHSRLLNPKRIDLMVTSTPEETARIVADGSPYVLTNREVVMTGLPRHDLLVERAQKSDPEIIAIAPTWIPELRDEIEEILDSFSGHENSDECVEALTQAVTSSPKLAPWIQLFNILENTDHLKGHVTFVVHPVYPLAVADVLDRIGIETVAGVEIAELLARTAVAVTDKSSAVGDAALVGASLIVLKPACPADEEAALPGAIVVESIDQAVEKIVNAALRRRTFDERFGRYDGLACERLYAAIIARTAGNSANS
ncbi:glycosyltransferase [Corynebacterium mendelii]|uniref:Glycosyltransferase family 2 protein n=1 Tax=Corynebacterium mendelii TaxID=2765362 RepID=A0A939IZ39_9CORY|nr:glycosyltransferase family 2 protein [Corynebacterium mendelii]MBN9645307.1 glycosyltransferase family 2 protein [Corynebacterium mendelii]